MASTTAAPAPAPTAPAAAPVAQTPATAPVATKSEAPAPAPVAQVSVVSVKPAIKMIEVLLIRKFQPECEYVYDPATMTATVVMDKDGVTPLKQATIPYDEALDKFGQRHTIMRQTFIPAPEGYRIPLLEAEAKRALKLGIAQITDNSFN